MQKFARLAVISAIAMGSTALAAEEVSHTWVEAGYGYTELAGGAADGDGFALGGSIELPSNFVLAAGYQDFDIDNEAHLKDITAGVGYKFALTDSFDIVAGASFERVELEDEGESGFGLSLAARTRVTEKLELSAGLKYLDIKQLPTTFSASLGGRYYFTPAVAGGVEVRKGDALGLAGETRFVATLRYDFAASRR